MDRVIYVKPVDRRFKTRYPVLAVIEIPNDYRDLQREIEDRLPVPYMIEVYDWGRTYHYLAHHPGELPTNLIPVEYRKRCIGGVVIVPGLEVSAFFHDLGYHIEAPDGHYEFPEDS